MIVSFIKQYLRPRWKGFPKPYRANAYYPSQEIGRIGSIEDGGLVRSLDLGTGVSFHRKMTYITELDAINDLRRSQCAATHTISTLTYNLWFRNLAFWIDLRSVATHTHTHTTVKSYEQAHAHRQWIPARIPIYLHADKTWRWCWCVTANPFADLNSDA